MDTGFLFGLMCQTKVSYFFRTTGDMYAVVCNLYISQMPGESGLAGGGRIDGLQRCKNGC